MLDRSTVAYAPFYCEENVWQLSRHPQLPAGLRYVIFISNHRRSCAIWSQRAAQAPGSPVIWDYHAVLLVEGEENLVFDLDSTAGVPLDLERYLAATFPFGERVERELRPLFRIVEAGELRRTFSSDRSHMRDGDTWRHPPPPWPPIQAPSRETNLDDFIDMRSSGYGEVVDLRGLRGRFDVPQT